ncbi:MAG: SdrD B-like domain-containing protein [Planctomycetota bacterium]
MLDRLKSLARKQSPTSSQLHRRRLLVQNLEDRRVLAALGLELQFPRIFSNSTGSVSYDAGTDTFRADATSLDVQLNETDAIPVWELGDFELEFQVDSNGDFAGNSSNANDFTLTGGIDFDFPIEFPPVVDVDGVLLTGNVIDFGFEDGSPTTIDNYEVRLVVTGGLLTQPGVTNLNAAIPAYFAGDEIGITLNSENSSFTGSFDTDFSGGNKAFVAPVDPAVNPATAELGNFVWVDANFNGLQDDGATGVNGVTVNLYRDNGDGIADTNTDEFVESTVTAELNGEDGFYLFDELAADDYFVEFVSSTLPAGFEFTDQDQGTDDAVDSDADPVSGLAIVTTLDGGESDLTWDAGIRQTVNPDIMLVKHVCEFVTTAEMNHVDFDGPAAGTIVSTQFPGVVISAQSNRDPNAGNRAMIFDSAAPSGGDLDLGTPNTVFGGPGVGSGGATNENALGNILIISEDGDTSDPDDDAQGGTFTFSFEEPVTIDFLELLDIDNDESGGSVVTLTTELGTQTIAIPTAGNNSFQRLDINVNNVTEMTVDFVSSGAITNLKYTSFSAERICDDANTGPGPEFLIGETIEFEYEVSNPGDIGLFLTDDAIIDDNATPADTSDDFAATPVKIGEFNAGDTNSNGRLDVDEVWLFTAEIIATAEGVFTNTAVVTGTPVNDLGFVVGDDITDDDPANYSVAGVPGIEIEKLTNGVDADAPEEAVEIAAGDEVTWTYLVTNTGSTSFAESEVSVTDDNGTPADQSDDFTPTLVADSDLGGDGLLSPGEVWEYSFTSTAEQITSAGETQTISLTGSSSLDGENGNVRSYTIGGVNVSATAFSRDNNGEWSTAFLGAYSSGLGVTDRSEGNGSGSRHRVDNIGQLNFVLFEFSEDVIVDAAFLDSVVDDSDLSVWIGSRPSGSSGPLQLADDVLAGLALNEVSNTSSQSSRWADFNASGVSGNVLVLAASVEDHSPEDKFKIRKLKFDTLARGVYGNLGTVNAADVTDTDPSHYTNPEPAPSASIGDFVWNDVDRDGKQDSGEDGIAGLEVTLYDDQGTVLETTASDDDGFYSFDGLEGGSYRIGFDLPSDFVFTQQRGNVSDSLDSDVYRNTGLTDVVELADHEVTRSVDAGLYEATVDVMFEAEDYEWIDWPWKVKNDSDASGGQYLVARNGTGSYYNRPPSGRKVAYDFQVDQDGRYELSALLRAGNSADNSVWFRVDGGHWIQWHTPVTGSHYDWHQATSGWNKDAVSFDLDAGSHSLELKVREDGTRFDKFLVSKLSTTTIFFDATDGAREGAWEVDVDDDGNEFLVANDIGNFYHAPPAGEELSFDFTLDQAGTFEMHALVSAANSSENSFWIQINDGDWVEWHLDVTGDDFRWQTVTNGSNRNEMKFDLEAGNHTLKIKVREDGTKLSKIAITDDAFIDLSDD